MIKKPFQVGALLLISIVTLSACAKPTILAEHNYGDEMMLCPQIAEQIQIAENAKREANADNRFKMRYMLIFPAALSMYNMHKADKAADNRLAYLRQLYGRKGCTYGGGMGSRRPTMYPPGSGPSQGYPQTTPGMTPYPGMQQQQPPTQPYMY